MNFEDGVREILNRDKFVCLRGKPLYDCENGCALGYFFSGKARRSCMIGIFFRCNSSKQSARQDWRGRRIWVVNCGNFQAGETSKILSLYRYLSHRVLSISGTTCFSIRVNDKRTKVDKSSWQKLCSQGTKASVNAK